MKRVVTVLVLVAAAFTMNTAAMAQGKFDRLVRRAAPAGASITAGIRGLISSTESSPVFLSKFKGAEPLANVKESLSYFQDTTGGNEVLYTADFDSTGLTRVRYPDGTIVDTFITMHYKGVGERFTTGLKTAYLDSINFTFFPHTLSPTDHLVFWVRPVYDVIQTDGSSIPFIDYFNQNAPVHITKQVIYTSPLALDTLNTITVKFGHLLLSANNHNFAVVAQPVGPGIATDSIFYQMDANLGPVQSPWTVDTDQSRSYEVRYDSILQIAGNSPLGDLQEVKGGQLTGQAYFGNLIMIANLSGIADAVGDQPASLNRLDQNYPNPVVKTTEIGYRLAANSPVSIKLYNAIGDEVVTVLNANESMGEHTATFDASKLQNGMYFYKLQSGEFNETKSMVVSR